MHDAIHFMFLKYEFVKFDYGMEKIIYLFLHKLVNNEIDNQISIFFVLLDFIILLFVGYYNLDIVVYFFILL